MKTSLLLTAAAVTALSVAACSKPASSADSAAANTSDATAAATPAAASSPNVAGSPAASAAAAPLPTTAADFVNTAAASDMFEITEAKIAEQKSSNAQVKAFAKMMITDHTKSTANLKAAIAKSGQSITPPTALPADKQALVDALNGATGADFDKTYMTQQVDAHTQTLAAMQAYASGGDTPALKDFATSTAKVVQMHLDKAKSIQSSLK